MSSIADSNFMPAVRCPVCNHLKRACISGWGRSGLNVRFTTCPECGTDFNVLVFVEALNKEEIDNDCHLSATKSTIAYLRKARKERTKKLEEKLQQERDLYHGVHN